MKAFTKPPEAATDNAPLSTAERSELHRQGAKSAARGESPAANPLREPRNRPPATGESSDMWSQRSDAWEEGHKAQSASRQPAPHTDDRSSPPTR